MTCVNAKWKDFFLNAIRGALRCLSGQKMNQASNIYILTISSTSKVYTYINFSMAKHELVWTELLRKLRYNHKLLRTDLRNIIYHCITLTTYNYNQTLTYKYRSYIQQIGVPNNLLASTTTTPACGLFRTLKLERLRARSSAINFTLLEKQKCFGTK